MTKVSAKRQVTLPKEQCVAANINAGDDVECFVERQGVISIVKKQSGAGKGLLEGIATHSQISVQESLDSAIDKQ
ncbi:MULTISPECIES: AbrB/MazE/SpoVT family DNA-binding domain-containing protein [Gammaproteobacteria]|uniref:AbrB/MazE/SpoVT family DNA-binding domain-containing protein n=1 Tax=Gammaproteobacteria TaxID=1236 RepID=UPI000DD06810|nr:MULTISPECIES: AbrB/MazE/SpoVT family DNA-binding domain-containing protein [Gammaproteobacteria]RTE85504.1 AbrB/MazE/SpoVT family DNA-binding domain-containing protein [Aliidiomarina sp. B3213]TCZ89473.1 AbrB/MazE/SpoVT family DNA-binding domain-containing protein [Lysobacter sp. N42]